jgi:hypothetical protein
MLTKILLFSLLFTLAHAQEGSKKTVTISRADFKKDATFNDALDQVYKKIIPKKSTVTPNTCFWMLGDKGYIIATANLPGNEIEIEPMLIKVISKPETNSLEYIVNKNEELTLKGLKESIEIYLGLAQANDAEPLIMIERSDLKLSEGLDALKLIREFGIKRIFIPAPIAVKQREPEIPLPIKRPVSPHQ